MGKGAMPFPIFLFPGDLMLIEKENQLEELIDKLKTEKFIAFDFETLPSGVHTEVKEEEASVHHKMLVIEGMSLRSENIAPVYIPFINTEIPRLVLNEKFHALFSQDSLFIAHNIQFDAKIADYFFGARPKNKFCTLVGYWYLDENVKKDKVSLGSKLFKMATIPYKEAKKVGEDRFLEYALMDAEFTYQLYFYLKEHLEPKHFELASGLEMDFMDVLIDMTLYGTPCDLEYLKKGEATLTDKAIELEAKIYRELGEFNIGSPQQLCEKLYGIKISRKKEDGKFKSTFTKVEDFNEGKRNGKYAPVISRTETGSPSTNDKVLSRLDTPTAKLLQEYRGIMKLLSTYAKGYQKYVIDSKIYPTFNNSGRDSHQYGTVTGRLSSSAPNMQNISHEPTEGWWLREAIAASPGRKLIVADEAQLEVRLLAHWSKDPALIRAIWSGEDIHLATAKLIFSKEEIDKEERRFAKTMNFAISYGQGIQVMAEKLFKSTSDEAKEEAKQFRYRYFATFETVEAWVKHIGDVMTNPSNKDHHVKTILGRKRRLYHDLPIIMPGDSKDEIRDKRGQIARCKRQAVNSIIQGSAADVLKVAMVHISQEFKEKGLDAHIILQIHDELVVDCAEDAIEEAAGIVKRHMEVPFGKPLRVPLEVKPLICNTWAEGKD